MPSGPVASARLWSGLDVRNLESKSAVGASKIEQENFRNSLVLSIRSSLECDPPTSSGLGSIQWRVVANVCWRVWHAVLNLKARVGSRLVLHAVLLTDIVNVNVLALNPPRAVSFFSSRVSFCFETKTVAWIIVWIGERVGGRSNCSPRHLRQVLLAMDVRATRSKPATQFMKMDSQFIRSISIVSSL